MTRIARVRYRGDDVLAVLAGDHYIDATKAYAAYLVGRGFLRAEELALGVLPPDLLEYFRGGTEAADALQEAIKYANGVDRHKALAAGIIVPKQDARALVPIPNPPKIVCMARNYGKHAEEAGLQISEIPILFPRFAATQIADGDPIIVPSVSEQLDWEGELAVVVGSGGRAISCEKAWQHVGGYTIFNDVTVRDYQFRVSQYTAGKNFHASGPVGPSITLVDEGLNPHALEITTSVNDVIKQSANTSELLFDVPALIEHISEFIELEAGDIIPTGTPAGVGFKRQPPEFLRDGDVVAVSIEGLGTLTNPVRRE